MDHTISFILCVKYKYFSWCKMTWHFAKRWMWIAQTFFFRSQFAVTKYKTEKHSYFGEPSTSHNDVKFKICSKKKNSKYLIFWNKCIFGHGTNKIESIFQPSCLSVLLYSHSFTLITTDVHTSTALTVSIVLLYFLNYLASKWKHFQFLVTYVL